MSDPAHSRHSAALRRSVDASLEAMCDVVAGRVDGLGERPTAAHLHLLARLRGILRAERQRGLAGHWAYDLCRHRRLLAAYRRLALGAVRPDAGRPPPPKSGA